MAQAAGGQLEVHRSAVTGLPSFVGTAAARAIPVAVPPGSRPEDRALEFLNSYGPALGLKDKAAVRLKRVHGLDDVGMERVRFQQVHKGVPVTGGEVSIHLRGANVVALNAKTLPDLDTLDTTPRITPAQALATARVLLAKHFDVWNATLSRPRLEILNRGLLEATRHPTRLAWFIEARRTDLRRYLWVDAQTGGVLLDFNQLPHGLFRSVYDAGSGSTLPGTLVRGEGESSTGDADADLAYDYAGDTYNYFLTEHGRDSYDNAGAPLISSVHYCPSPSQCPYANAFWNGSQMVYGTGFPVADDVVAHELTHAVTEHTASLFYYMQSGALDESYADIFGETVDLWNGRGTDTPAVRWLMGEDLPGIGAIRNMMDPTVYGDPGKVSDSQFVCATPGTDAGGVHSDSGVPNHAYALMVDGGTYNGYSINGIGLTKAAKIEYRALTHYLLSGSDFLDNYNALKQACQDLIGSYGITAADYTEVVKALDAVEMSATWPCTPLQPATPLLCGPGQTHLDLFFDDLENAGGNWSTRIIVGANAWYLGSFFATSGTRHLYGDDPDSRTDSCVEMSADVAIPAGGAHLQFNHCYGFEVAGTTFYDGGIIEYSTNGGTTWTNAGGMIVAGAAYGGEISSARNPLKGRNAFVGASYGYVTTQLDLASLADHSVRFRFRMGADNSVGDYGWFIDDVRIYQCADVNDPPTVTVPGTQSVHEDTSLTVTGISVADPDVGSFNMEVTLSVANGTLSLSQTTGLTFSVGDGVSDSIMTFQGMLANVNAALNNLAYRPNPDDNGADTLHVTANDLGHTGVGGAESDSKLVSITINPVNDAPSFVAGANQTVAQNSGPQTVPGWATAISSGPANESGQAVDFIVTHANPSLFSGQPSIAAGGTLTFTPATNVRGSVLVTVQLYDNGGTANGGHDTSGPQTFTLTIGDAADNNVNGLPDDWEQAYFGSGATVLPDEDSDGDGFTNLQELLAGTDPTKPDSALGVTATDQALDGVRISFTTAPGKTYRVDYNDTSPAGPWIALPDSVLGTGGIQQVTDSGGLNRAKRFYRVVLVP